MSVKTSKHTCSTCNAEFSIKHGMDQSYYDVYFCPFCGAGIDDEDEDYNCELEDYENS